MELRFHPHAVQRMQERGVSVADLESVIQFPDGVISQSMDKKILFKQLARRKDNLIAVVLVSLHSVEEVITVLVNFEVRK